jgi:hypothetical protein
MINVTAAIIERDSKILIAKRSSTSSLPNKWEFPGGKKTASIYLLMDAWKFERDRNELDHFHFLDNAELLSVAEFMAIARQI